MFCLPGMQGFQSRVNKSDTVNNTASKSPVGHTANGGGWNWVKLSKVALLSRAWQ